MAKPRLLTKSRFKISCECPTKLFYTGKREYGSTKNDNSFLAALAEGGFQVGELAKLYISPGHEIVSLDYDESKSLTDKYLKESAVTLYEPALRYRNLFVRVDILRKNGNEVDLIEVKAKSIDPTEDKPFWKKKARGLNSEWEPYLLDVAFQVYVAQNAFPEWVIRPKLMLADKSSVASVDGLNQRFLIQKDGNRSRASVKEGTTSVDLGDPVLVEIDVSNEVNFLHNEWFLEGKSFLEVVRTFSDAYQGDTKLNAGIGSKCKSCEFRIGPTHREQGLKSGFDECWIDQASVSLEDLATRKPVFEIWNYRKSDKKIADGVLFIDNLEADEMGTFETTDRGLTPAARQSLQVAKELAGDKSAFVDVKGLRREFSLWTYPLHFIDFETTMVAIPFNKGRHPYEQMAFQFSHHVIDAGGSVSHKSQYINVARGKFPNFDFVRELKRVLSGDSGTIFRYATHENTVLRQISDQLRNSDEYDRVELCAWIETVTTDSESARVGVRTMVDLCDLVKKYYYHPKTDGSNSIKKVLPAILGSSQFLQELYSKPIYGASNGVQSQNFKDWCWIVKDQFGNTKDPYKLLAPVFVDITDPEMDSLIEGSIADGGAAMTAYARMQFSEMSDLEAQNVVQALLRYCELDTFAMVMIFQHWANEIGWKVGRKAA